MNRLRYIVWLVLLVAAAAAVVQGLRMLPVDVTWGWKLCAVGGLLAGGSRLLLRARSELRINLCLTIVVVAGSLFAFEACLELRPKDDPVRLAIPRYDRRSIMDVVRDLRSSGMKAVPSLTGASAVRDNSEGVVPLCGIATSTTVFCNESGDYVLYVSDEHGFNNPSGLPQQAELVIVGDSYAQGQCVPQGQDLAGRLRAGGHTAVSLGCGGNGPLLELATLVEYGLALNPRLVLWLYYEGNDPGDLQEEEQIAILQRYLEPDFSQRLRDRQGEVDAYWAARLPAWINRLDHEAVAPKISIKELSSLFETRALFGLRRVDQGDIGRPLHRVLARASDAAKGSGARIVLVYLTSWERLHAPFFRDRKAAVLRVAQELGLEVVDFAAAVSEAHDPDRFFPLRSMGHLSSEGYAFLAEVIERRALQGH
jgi:hypothetical protein